MSDDYTWPHLAGDLLHLLDQAAPSQHVCGVGQSMGAATLLHAACSDPPRFQALVLGIPPTAWSSRAAQQAAYLQTADAVEQRGIEELMDTARTAPRPPAVGPEVPITVPDVQTALLPSVFRGAARSDLPPREAIANLQVPTLLLCWAGDPAHPVSTARRLSQLLPQHRLEVAHTPADTATWPVLVAEHLAAHLSPSPPC
ncbi:MAG: alpha/beta hydrolase [Ornithinimicrobium sp.]